MYKPYSIVIFILMLLITGCGGSDLEDKIKNTSTYEYVSQYKCVDKLTFKEEKDANSEPHILMTVRFDKGDLVKLLEKFQENIPNNSAFNQYFRKQDALTVIKRLEPIKKAEKLLSDLKMEVDFTMDTRGKPRSDIYRFDEIPYQIKGKKYNLAPKNPEISGGLPPKIFISELYLKILVHAVMEADNDLYLGIRMALDEIMKKRLVIVSGNILQNLTIGDITPEGIVLEFSTNTRISRDNNVSTFDKIGTSKPYKMKVQPDFSLDEKDVEQFKIEYKKKNDLNQIDVNIGLPYPIGFLFGQKLMVIAKNEILWGEAPMIDIYGATISSARVFEEYQKWLANN